MGVVLVFVIWYQFFRPDPSLEGYQLPDQTTSEAEAAPGAPAAPAAAPTEGAQSQFREVTVDIDALIEGVQEVQFDYGLERPARNPMSPLVGPRYLRGGEMEEGLQDEETLRVQAELMARAMRLTAIVWDEYDPFAVINNEVVSTGYAFSEGIVVEAIEENRVVLRVGDTLIPVTLEEL
jgi:hypothetical protein